MYRAQRIDFRSNNGRLSGDVSGGMNGINATSFSNNMTPNNNYRQLDAHQSFDKDSGAMKSPIQRTHSREV